ncbi:coiled-coil domain-containing protein 33-like isoform X2 [Pomacea canaliculata]|nr:coiled-coil domain-containing protein 33-like isoform X2 [Pomacea canaliculata]
MEERGVTPRPTGIENKSLEYEVEIHDVQFNHTGRFFVKLAIQSLHTKDYSKVTVRKWPGEEYVRDFEALTDVVVQSDNDDLNIFEDRKFTFSLPKGFCKNDKNHDVYLLLEAFSLPEDEEDTGQKVGEGKVAIYPRTNAPRTNHAVSPGGDMYRFTDYVPLLRGSQVDKSQMHCGRLRCTFALREKVPQMKPPKPKLDPKASTSPITALVPPAAPAPEKKPETDKETQKKKDEGKKGELEVPPSPKRPPPVVHTPPAKPPPPKATPTSVWGDNVSLNLPKSPSPPPLTDSKRLSDSPLPDLNQSTFSANPAWRYTALKGNEQFDVIVHGASGLPTARDGHVPLPYVILKTKHDDDIGVKARAKTHAVVRPTHVPSWEEMISVEVDEPKSENEVLVLSVGDATTKQGLVKYLLPASSLKPFHQYHLEMVMPTKSSVGGAKTYVSIIRRQSTLPQDPACPNYLGLEVFLRAVQRPLQNPAGPLIAVARIVPDYHNYRTDTLQSHPRAAGISMTSVTFPNPHPSSFSVPEQSSQGYPQVSLIGRPAEQPRWNHPFLFCDKREKATMFTPSAALVIEYYVANAAMTDEFWKIRSPVGFSSVLLDQRMYSQLSANNASLGMRVEGVPIQGSDLYTVDNTAPTVGMVMRLIKSDQPDSMVAMSNMENLPEVTLHQTDSTLHAPDVLTLGEDDAQGSEVSSPAPDSPVGTDELLRRLQPATDRSRRVLPIKDGEMPPYDAMETILPEYRYIFTEPSINHDREPGRTRGTTMAPTTRQTRLPTDLEHTSMSVMDQQLREIDNYRQAVQRMGQDILSLRTTIRELEGTNSKLRLELGNYSDATRLIIDSSELDALAKPELTARYAALKQKLAAQTTELKAYKDKVQKLQNELIKKNDKEKEYLRMSHAHASQQELLQRLQEKVNKVRQLEDTCKKQEKVIEKMERILEKQRDKTQSAKDMNSEANGALIEENKRLRQQIEEIREQLNRGGRAGEDLEKLELYQALERSEGRIMSLEKQLADNSRQWGRERAELQIRMSETDNGFGRAGGLVLHDYPLL